MSRAELKWIDFRGENFRSEVESNTTSDLWVDKLAVTTNVLKAGSILISQFAEIGQSKAGRNLGHRIQWKPTSSPTWITISETLNGVNHDDVYTLSNCWDIVQLASEDSIDIRVQWGQTTEGGIARIRRVRVGVVRIGQLGDFI